MNVLTCGASLRNTAPSFDLADAIGNPIVTLIVRRPNGTDLRLIGREAWALAQLLDVGARGMTTIERPAPRLSHYVFKLRQKGIVVETIDEKHGGAFSGLHARYVLKTPLTVVAVKRQHDRRGAA